MIIKTQNGREIYSDGDETELNMLRIAQEYPGDLAEEYIANDNRYTINNTFSAVRQNILNWYDFKEQADILEIGAGMGSISGMLCDKAKTVTALEMNEIRAEIIRIRHAGKSNLTVISDDINYWSSDKKYDYIVMIGVLEYATVFTKSKKPAVDFLKKARSFLKPDGILLVAIENRFGLKYWSGGSEDHIQEPYVGIEGYHKTHTPITYSRAELTKIIGDAGFGESRFYNVLPDYKFPNLIFSDDYKIHYNDTKKVPFTYSKGSMLNFNEKDIYKEIISNNVEGFFANSFLVEISNGLIPSDHVEFVSLRGECKKEYRIATTIDSNENVCKVPVHKEAEKHINAIYQNERTLASRGVSLLDSNLDGNRIRTKRVNLLRADKQIETFLEQNDLKSIIELIECLKENLLKSSNLSIDKGDIAEKNELNMEQFNLGVVLKDGYIDMNFCNSFYDNGSLTFFDQEWKFENVPLNFLLYYAVKIVSLRCEVKTNIKLETILDYLQIGEERIVFDRIEEYVWSTVLYRQNDFYGGDGYCNQFKEELTTKDILKKKDADIASLRDFLSLTETEIGDLKNCKRDYETLSIRFDGRERELKILGEQLSWYEEEIEKLKDNYNVYEEEHTTLEAIFKSNRNEIDELKVVLANKEGHINLLLESDRELQRIKSSRSWRFMTYVWKIRDLIVPIDSKRRLVIKIAVRSVKSPIKMARKITPSRIKNFFYFLNRDGVGGVSKRIDDCFAPNQLNNAGPEIKLTENDISKAFHEYEKLGIPCYEKPKVSIVIPVYNQFDYTYNCLKSIVENSGEVSYEVIVANDCSCDLTTRIREIITGINVIDNETNLRFLKNCNNAAQNAKGEYILFLNNDTQVQENWLAPLVNLIESDSLIGMVGSKLVYPDGRLQEAGGIMWSDGSAWNYGHGSDSDEPEYNYVKEVDYISGASIMVRRDLWERIGGFDMDFAPAYCEDSDLAFTIRSMGLKVMYQPLSVVVHFEGRTNGIDVTCGQKAFQVENQMKFFEKWNDKLKMEHFEHGQSVFSARDRSKSKKTILFIDHYVPMFDKDAGSRTVFQYLKLFVKEDYNVKFIGDNFYKHEPYTTVLQQMGIEVLYGPYYANHWKHWLKENHENIEYVFLNRPHISAKYIDYIKGHTNAKVIYYGHDLHFLREYREYELTGDEDKLKSSTSWKFKELQLMKKANISYYPSYVEIDEIKKIDDNIAVKAIPAYLFDSIDRNEYHFEKRKDIMFIGGFAHTPNVDAVLWFHAKVLPELMEKKPDLVIHILGSNPPESISNLNSKCFKIHGFVSDDVLEEFYSNTRFSIVPLRYGAGIKGKVVESMKYGCPVVTTTVGAEGLDETEEIMGIVEAGDEKAFTNKILELYDNEVKLRFMSEASYQYIEDKFTPQNAIEVIGPDFDFTRRSI